MKLPNGRYKNVFHTSHLGDVESKCHSCMLLALPLPRSAIDPHASCATPQLMQMPEFKAQGQLVETVHNRLLANLKDFGEDSMSPMKKRDVPPAAVGTVPAESKGVPSEDRYTTLSLKVVSPAGPLGIFLDQKSDTAVVQGPPKSSTAKSKGLNALRVMDGLAGMSIISIDGQNTRNFSGQHVVQW